MYRHHIVAFFAFVGVLVAFSLPLILYAQQGEKSTDFRNRPYSTEELEQALFPEEKTKPWESSRSIGPQKPAAATLNVFFAFNSDRILPKHHEDLNKLGEVLSRHPNHRFQIEGHTDSIGSERYNQSLSEKRAASIKRYLVQNFQVTSEHLRAVGYGENKPRTTNDTEEGRSENRRVELVNLGQ